MSVQLNVSAKEMPAVAQSQPAANAQPQKGKGAQSNPGTEIEPFLLEGCTLPRKTQELVVSYLCFKKETYHAPYSLQTFTFGNRQVTNFEAAKGEVCIDALCERMGKEAEAIRASIFNLRMRFNDTLRLTAPGCPRPEDDFECGYGLSRAEAFKLCEDPKMIFAQTQGLNEKYEELLQLLQQKKSQAVYLTYYPQHSKESPNLKLALPTVECLQIQGAFDTLDVRECPSLKRLECTGVTQIDARNLGCTVKVTSEPNCTLLATDGNGNQVTVEGTLNFRRRCHMIDFNPNAQEVVEKKAEGDKT